LELHREKTIQRMKEHEVVLAIQDTSTLSYQTHLNKENLGVIGKPNAKSNQSRGLIMHTLLAVTPQLSPLGILDHMTWARQPRVERERLNIEKESLKWVKSLVVGSLAAKNNLPKTRIITVSDRESDINIYLGSAYETGCEVIVRAMDRRVDFITGKSVIESISEMPVIGHYALDLTKRSVSRGIKYKRKSVKLATPIKREAQVEVRAGPVLIKVQGANGKVEVPFNCVYVKEKKPGKEALEWILLTSLEIKDFSDAQKVISYYKARWFIEVFHKTLKSGCGVEESRLQEASRLQNYLLMMSLAAIQICQLTYLQRSEPDKSCETILPTTYWKTLYLYHNKGKPLPTTPPSLNEVTIWIAKLGGFLARKGDGYPGTLTMWKGWLRLQDLHEAFLLFGAQNCG
jgi:hypothetical protein